MWNAESVEAELERYEPELGQFGIRDPLRWARARVAGETDWASSHPWWERRIAHWRTMLLDEEPAGWTDWLDLGYPALAPSRERLQVGGQQARGAWAQYVREAKPDLLRICDDSALRGYLFLTQGQCLYAPDGSFLSERAEALLEGQVHELSLPPQDGGGDYDWVQTTNTAGWFIRYLAAAWYHQRDPKWVREFQSEIVAMVLGDSYELSGFSAVASRLSLILPTYLLMKDSPAMSDAFHGICSRWLWAHAQHLHAEGREAYKDNTLHHSALAEWLAIALFPEFRGSGGREKQLWPKYLTGWQGELLTDHCHEQRSLAYHTNFIRRAIALLGLAKALDLGDTIPAELHGLVSDTVDVFVRMSTPSRATPGVNDDVTVNWDYRPLLGLAADLFDRDDWRHLATDGTQGTAPSFRSVLLPDAQLAAMRSDWSPDARWLFFKVSPHGSAHHHRDTLGIQIWAGSRKLLVEPYVGDYAFERDVYNRSWWHSTPTLGADLLPPKAQPKVLYWETGDELEYAAGQIRIPVAEDAAAVTVRRHIFFVDRSWWVIWDEFVDLPDCQVVWENFHLVTRQLHIDKEGGLVMTALPGGPNLLMRVGTPGWHVSQEDTRMWPVYSHDTEPTATLHYAGDATAAGRGFAALFAVVDGPGPPPETAFERIDRLEDGRVRLEVSVAGDRATLTTRLCPPS